jgi:hypothetical protein
MTVAMALEPVTSTKVLGISGYFGNWKAAEEAINQNGTQMGDEFQVGPLHFTVVGGSTPYTPEIEIDPATAEEVWLHIRQISRERRLAQGIVRWAKRPSAASMEKLMAALSKLAVTYQDINSTKEVIPVGFFFHVLDFYAVSLMEKPNNSVPFILRLLDNNKALYRWSMEGGNRWLYQSKT